MCISHNLMVAEKLSKQDALNFIINLMIQILKN